MSDPQQNRQPIESGLDRRSLLIGGGVLAAGALAYSYAQPWLNDPTPVFVARNQTYAASLRTTIIDGLIACGLRPLAMRGKKVLLKPNLVEPTRSAPHMTTHPAVVTAVAEVFRGWGAEVSMGEGPGHVRDTDLALVESGLQTALDETHIRFHDLNYQDVAWVKNRGGASKLDGFYFPQAVLEADLIVSLPKMKTHHWMGVTASLKNMYGVIPGSVYGWPKNVLHHNGIAQTVFDINSSLPPTVTVVDGIECMEGDGPIMGSPRHCGLMVMGLNLTAVDATVCRLMQIMPQRIPYLKLAGGRLGPLNARQIKQVGEQCEPLAQPFELLDRPELQRLRAVGAELWS